MAIFLNWMLAIILAISHGFQTNSNVLAGFLEFQSLRLETFAEDFLFIAANEFMLRW